MKTWKLVGGLVVIAAVAGLFLGKMVPGLPNLGLPGFETPAARPVPVATIPAVDESAEEVPQETSDDKPTEKSTPKPPALPEEAQDEKVLYVEVDGAGYRVPSRESGLRPASLDEIVQLVQEREGSAEGIKIRIKRLETSRYQSEVDLRDKLVAAGIERSAIVWLNGPPL